MKQINFIQLSDLHYGSKGQEWLWPTVEHLFYDSIKRVMDHIGPIHLVMFTGDLTYSGKKEQFDGVSRILESLWDYFGKLGAEPRFVSVPGNHDLLRRDIIDPTMQAFKNWHQNTDIQDLFWSTADNPYKRFINEVFNNYSEWYTNLTIPKPNITGNGFLVGENSYILNVNDLRLGIVGLNTAFLQLSEGVGKALALHPKQILSVCDNNISKWKQSTDIALLITHHGHNWLDPTCTEIYKSQIYQQDIFFAHFYGHLHEPYTYETSECGSIQRRFRQGPSLFGTMHYGPNRTERIHGYIAGQYFLENGNLIEKIYPKKLVKSYAGNYKLVPDNQFELINNDYIQTTLDIFALKKTDSNEDGSNQNKINSQSHNIAKDKNAPTEPLLASTPIEESVDDLEKKLFSSYENITRSPLYQKCKELMLYMHINEAKAYIYSNAYEYTCLRVGSAGQYFGLEYTPYAVETTKDEFNPKRNQPHSRAERLKWLSVAKLLTNNGILEEHPQENNEKDKFMVLSDSGKILSAEIIDLRKKNSPDQTAPLSLAHSESDENAVDKKKLDDFTTDIIYYMDPDDKIEISIYREKRDITDLRKKIKK